MQGSHSIDATLSTRPSDLHDSTLSRPAELRSTGFGTTSFGGLATAVLRPTDAAAGFDVCHVGVVLRALLFVHGVLAVGVLFAAGSWSGWLTQFSLGAGSALPAVLMWLLLLCASKRTLVALPVALQWTVAIGLGALCGVVGSVLAWLPGSGGAGAIPGWLAPAAAGGALAAMLFQ